MPLRFGSWNLCSCCWWVMMKRCKVRRGGPRKETIAIASIENSQIRNLNRKWVTFIKLIFFIVSFHLVVLSSRILLIIKPEELFLNDTIKRRETIKWLNANTQFNKKTFFLFWFHLSSSTSSAAFKSGKITRIFIQCYWRGKTSYCSYLFDIQNVECDCYYGFMSFDAIKRNFRMQKIKPNNNQIVRFSPLLFLMFSFPFDIII